MFRSGFPGLILPDHLRFGNAGILQNPVHIIGENQRYIEPFLADRERGCQGPGSHKATLYAVEREGSQGLAPVVSLRI